MQLLLLGHTHKHTFLANSCFCASSASCTSNICRRFSSRRVAGEALSSVSVRVLLLVRQRDMAEQNKP
jgi:hypothetical protein